MAKDRKRKRKEEGPNGGREGEREKDRETEMERKEAGKEGREKTRTPGHSSSLKCATHSMSEAPALTALAHEQIKHTDIHPESGRWFPVLLGKVAQVDEDKRTGCPPPHNGKRQPVLQADGLAPSKWPCDA